MHNATGTVGQRLGLAVAHFDLTMDSIRALALRLAEDDPGLLEPDDLPEGLRLAVSALPQEDRDKISKAMDVERDKLRYRMKPGENRQLGEDPSEAPQGSDETDGPMPRFEVFINAVFEVFENNPGAAMAFAQWWIRTLHRPQRMHMLRASLLVSAVAAFELLLGRLYGMRHRCFPGLLRADDKEFSLADLRGFETIEDAEDAAIEKRVEKFLYDSFEEWATWFERAGFPLEQFAIDLPAVNEAIQRRHLLIHTGGVVSPLYVQRVPGTKAPVGARLSVGPSYLEEALDNLHVLGVGLGQACIHSWMEPTDRIVVFRVSQRCVEFLSESRWNAAVRLAEIGLEIEKGSWTREALRVNRWLGMKGRGNTDEVHAEVREWDTSGLATEFTLARLCLLNDDERALDLLEDLVAKGEVGRAALVEWPLFVGIREHDRFLALTKSTDARAAADRLVSETPAEQSADPSPASAYDGE